MKDNDWHDVVSLIGNLWPRIDFNKDIEDAWAIALKHKGHDDVCLALKTYRAQSSDYPVPSEVEKLTVRRQSPSGQAPFKSDWTVMREHLEATSEDAEKFSVMSDKDMEHWYLEWCYKESVGAYATDSCTISRYWKWQQARHRDKLREDPPPKPGTDNWVCLYRDEVDVS